MMTAQSSIPWASAAPTRPQDRRSRPRPRRAPLPTVERAHTPLFAVQCAICEKLGPVFASRERAYAPPKNSGWRYLTVALLAVGGQR